MESSSTPSSQASAPPPPPSLTFPHPKPARVLACVLCQHRKIKCDRNFPCANCQKAQVRCVPSTPAPARKRRRPNQDLQDRLTRCEDLLKKFGNEKPLDGNSPRPSINSDELRWQPAGKLVREDGNVRFVDSPLLQVVYDEVQAMKEMAMAEDDSDDSDPETMTPDENSEMLLSGDTPAVVVESLRPNPAQMLMLWQLYLARVNPLTKIIHVPSVEPYLVGAATGSMEVPKSMEALLLSIYLMAVVSMTPDECRARLGHAREAVLQSYSSAVRLSLVRINFLRHHNFTVLQALVIYLISLQGRYNRHAVWILNGVAIRIAQKMGLHRDGEALGLPPFECEMRRRLWWQIVMVDAKYAMFSGLTHSLLPSNCNTGSPKNLNDADISPSAEEPFEDREGPTEMIFCLLTHKFAKFLMDTPGFEGVTLVPEDDAAEGGNDSGPTEEQLVEYRRSVATLREELIEVLDKYSDPNAGPVHEMANTMRDHLVHRLNELGTPPKELADWGNEVKSAKDNAFKHAICMFEHDEVNYMSTKDQGFAWFTLLHFHIDIFMYMVGQLRHRTEGSLVKRAWHQVEVVYTFHPELFDSANKKHTSLASHIIHAWDKRAQALLAATGQYPETPFYVEKLRTCMPDPEYKEEQTPASLYTPPELLNSNLDGGVLPDPGLMMPDDPMDFIGLFSNPTLEWDMFNGHPVPAPNPNPPYQPSEFGPFGMGPTGPQSHW